MKIPCVSLLVVQFSLYLVAADTTSGDDFSLDPVVVAKAANFNFGFEPRRGFQSLAQFLVLSGMPKEDVKSSLQDLSNPKQLTPFEGISGYIAQNIVTFTIASQSSIEFATAFSLINSIGAMPSLMSYCPNSYLDPSPQNLVAKGNIAGQAAGCQLRVQGFDNQEDLIQRIKSQLKDKKPVMVLIYDKAASYFNIISHQEDYFTCLSEAGKIELLDKNQLLKAMDYNSSINKLSIKNFFWLSGSKMGQFTIIEQSTENIATQANLL